MTSTVTLLLFLLAAAICGLCLAVPAWRNEQERAARFEAHAKALEESLTAVKTALTKLQIQHQVTRDELLACREEMVARGSDELRKLPSVDAANALLRGSKS